MSKLGRLISFLLLILSPSICTDRQVPENVNYRSVGVDLNFKSAPTNSLVVVKKRDESNVPNSFTKYVLYGTERNEYFHASAVLFGGENIVIDGNDLTVKYVYDVYTYWKNGRILLVSFRYYYAGLSSYYKYYKKVDKTWSEVQGTDYDANSYGMLSTENLTKLLNVIESENPKPVPQEEKKDTQAESKKFTVIVVSVIVISLLVLLLVGLAFYFFK